MTLDPDTARDDLAFIRAIVEERRPGLRAGGFLYAAAGAIYGTQALIAAAIFSGAAPALDDLYGWVVLAANGLFMALIGGSFWRHRKDLEVRGAASRAISATFAGVGLANGAVALGFALISIQTQDEGVWFVFPIVVCGFQGAVWYMFAMVAKRAWMGVVAAGWYVAAVVMGALISQPTLYLVAVAAALFALMAVPGAVLMRAANDG